MTALRRALRAGQPRLRVVADSSPRYRPVPRPYEGDLVGWVLVALAYAFIIAVAVAALGASAGWW